MRRTSALLISSALLLAGCSGGRSADSGAHATGHRPLPVPTVSVSRQAVPADVTTDRVLPAVAGTFGRKATITIPKSEPSGKFVVNTVLRGHGRKAGTDDIVIVNYTAKTWKHGTELPGTYGNGGSPRAFPVGRGAVIPALDRAVQGQRAGSRILVVAPPAAAYGTTGNVRSGVSGTDTVVFVVDVVKVLGARSTVPGKQGAAPRTLPRVSAGGSTVLIAVPDAAAPKSPVSRTLIAGTGPQVERGQTVVLRRAGAVWASNRGDERATLFDSSWSQGAAPVVIGRGNLIEGLDDAVIGAKVGSRMLLVIRPEQAYGAQPRKGIPAGSTLVYVVDILAAV